MKQTLFFLSQEKLLTKSLQKGDDPQFDQVCFATFYTNVLTKRNVTQYSLQVVNYMNMVLR